jgi:hypothetical protein
MLLTTAVLFVNLSIPKKQFPTMEECMQFKAGIEKQLIARHNPVNLFYRLPTVSCSLIKKNVPDKKVAKTPTKEHVQKPTKVHAHAHEQKQHKK